MFDIFSFYAFFAACKLLIFVLYYKIFSSPDDAGGVFGFAVDE